MLIYAHRGCSKVFPENTMEAFEHAIDIGVDGIELDVQLSKDGEVVIVHDENLKRLTGEDAWVFDLTLAELKELNFAKNRDDFNHTEIPVLEEYLDIVKGCNLITNIELKTSIFSYPGLIDKVAKLIKQYKLEEKVIISSFNHLSLMESKRIIPEAAHAVLEASNLVKPVEYLKRLNMEYFHPLFTTIDEDMIQSLNAEGIYINAWTVDNPEHASLLKELGVRGIISNVPEVLQNLK
ncbi:glycerophosphodiester phosphodiesterase [Microaceticoccus formicicus]|uniref:glycerophosphodiester phosphodiesterase n=1 Tax=Microaceticoccus formicicus TaxID=3118105 RepID=UPI003CD0206A|nr:glycerophosphodiester phosphodiesterase family protein [Peptoniphilaceae bacterium AMB_02]